MLAVPDSIKDIVHDMLNNEPMKPDHKKLTYNAVPKAKNSKNIAWIVFFVESKGYKFHFATIQFLSGGEYEVHGSQFEKLESAIEYVHQEYDEFVLSLLIEEKKKP